MTKEVDDNDTTGRSQLSRRPGKCILGRSHDAEAPGREGRRFGGMRKAGAAGGE